MTIITRKIYVVTDLGPGDGGKGGVVHKICHMRHVILKAGGTPGGGVKYNISRTMRPHTVLKRGGAQGSHGVRTSRGEKFAFSQWGCGTFEGIPTHLTEQMIISPEGLLNEAAQLKYRHGIRNPFDLLTVDERALVATPFHGIESRLKELVRGHDARGTIGIGVGAAYRDYQQRPSFAITAGDLKKPHIRDRLAAVRQQVQVNLSTVIHGQFLVEDKTAAEQEIGLLSDDGFMDHVVQRFEEAAAQIKVVSRDYLGEVILARDGVAVVETSHGVLTDRLAGFYPHTSAIRTLPRFTEAMLRHGGYDGQVVHIGVTRAYAIRHGAGPIPTADPAMAGRLLDGSAKKDNRYQGRIRVGPIDFVLLRYAIEACGGPSAFDGLAVTWFDQILTDGVWELCQTYRGAGDPDFFTPAGAIKLVSGTKNDEHFDRQAALGRKLLECSPDINRQPIDNTIGRDALYDVCAEVVSDAVGIPVRMVSFGPTELDKLAK